MFKNQPIQLTGDNAANAEEYNRTRIQRKHKSNHFEFIMGLSVVGMLISMLCYI